jgi:hypothetical protein
MRHRRRPILLPRMASAPSLALVAALASGLLACSDPEPRPAEVTAALRALDSADPDTAMHAFVEVAGRLARRIDAGERAALIAALDSAMTARPAELVASLEAYRRTLAVRRYAEAMIAGGRGESLGRQLALVLRGGDAAASPVEVLGRRENKDGSFWFPAAENAGFFAGAVAWGIEKSPDPRAASAAVAVGLGCRPEGEKDTWTDWVQAMSLRDCATGDRVRAGAREFERALRGIAGTAP